MQSLVEKLGIQVVAIDGKTHRGSYDRESKLKALHTVSAWASEHRLILGQTKVSCKSNEITAIPALLKLWTYPAVLLPLMQWVHKNQLLNKL